MRVSSAIALTMLGCAQQPDDMGPQAPTVTSFSATSAEYGAEITIEGSGFGLGRDEGAKILYTRPGDSEPQPSTPWRAQISWWSDEKIVFDAAFPLVGAISLQNEGGSTEAGVFEPASWIPGVGTPSREWGVLDVIALDETRVAALLVERTGAVPPRGPAHLFVFDGATVRDYPLVTADPAIKAKLARTPAGDPEALLVTEGATTRIETVFHARWNGQPELVTTDIDTNPTFVLGRDSAGLHIWAHAANDGYVRMDPPTWTPGPMIPRPTGTNAELVAAGGGAMFAYDIFSYGSTIDGRKMILYRLPPGGTQLEVLDERYDEDGLGASEFIAADDGLALGYRYCYISDGPLPFDEAEVCYLAVRLGGATWGYTNKGVAVAPHPTNGFGIYYRDEAAKDLVVGRPSGGNIVESAPFGLYAIYEHHAFFTPSGQARAFVAPESLDNIDDRYYAPQRR